METKTPVGMNKTGIDTSPNLSKEMMEGAESIPPLGNGMEGQAAAERATYISKAETFGSVPPPATAKGMLNTLKDKVMGRNTEVLIDKLGERLAFERSGTRLYDMMIMKCESGTAGVVDIARLREIRDEEYRHMQLVTETIEGLGADSTALTPCADAVAIASSGVVKLMTDPRTSVSQSLDALLTIELMDNAGWELLIKVTEEMGLSDTADQFRDAFMHESEHLEQVSAWLERSVMSTV